MTDLELQRFLESDWRELRFNTLSEEIKAWAKARIANKVMRDALDAKWSDIAAGWNLRVSYLCNIFHVVEVVYDTRNGGDPELDEEDLRAKFVGGLTLSYLSPKIRNGVGTTITLGENDFLATVSDALKRGYITKYRGDKWLSHKGWKGEMSGYRMWYRMALAGMVAGAAFGEPAPSTCQASSKPLTVAGGPPLVEPKQELGATEMELPLDPGTPPEPQNDSPKPTVIVAAGHQDVTPAIPVAVVPTTHEGEIADPFVARPMQKAILAQLNGQALKKQELADAVAKGDGGALYRYNDLKELRERGLVKHKSGVGFYRPDAPPDDE